MFIEIKGRILDKHENDRKVLLLKRLLQYEFSELTKKYGFNSKGKDKDEFVFCNEQTGLKVRVSFEQEKGRIV
ncbi:MAG: hypothetical protein ACP5N3_05390 [Candidatus Nanoarchaeia archaeon]